ncbi:hypothetical protein L1987_38465 [Smallanthus sonchifolius]|uniref:Uncharacterized protein n=1 Tax=Smallanthus sonchifolius TaxID=185202 RepID=A0ACB9HKN5_9ASTR|nr:hypothetical protein L1987_38465 [Smallanthus sonchifolius]
MKEADGNTGYTLEESGGRKRPKRQRKVIKDKLGDDAEEDVVVVNDETGGRKRSKKQRKVIQDKLYDDAEEDDVVENDGTGEKINRKRKRGVGKKKGLSKTPNAPKGIRSRSTPRQLCITVRRLSDKQKEAVKSMGFGKILSMRVDGIPTKLAYFVVDTFDQSKLEIDLGKHYERENNSV